MTDRLASDGDGVTTHRARLARSGGTRRPCLRLPSEVGEEPRSSDGGLTAGSIVRLVLDGDEYHARVESDASGHLIRGAYDNRRLARAESEGQNRLVEWVRGIDRETGQSVEFDEVTPGYLYGVRVPGRRTVYHVTRQPDSSLSSIAERLDE